VQPCLNVSRTGCKGVPNSNLGSPTNKIKGFSIWYVSGGLYGYTQGHTLSSDGTDMGVDPVGTLVALFLPWIRPKDPCGADQSIRVLVIEL